MSRECKHPELSVKWGDDRAYYERENELHLKDGRYQKFITGEWEARSSGWGDLDAEGHQWLISIYCERCDFTIMSNDDEITRRLKSFELAIVKQVMGMKP